MIEKVWLSFRIFALIVSAGIAILASFTDNYSKASFHTLMVAMIILSMIMDEINKEEK